MKAEQKIKMGAIKEITRRAIKLNQTPTTFVYQFALTGTELLSVADVSRISRDDTGKLIGYQRPEVRQHVQDIIEYLDGESVLFPHALIIALSSRVRFVSSRGPGVSDGISIAGTLHIPLPVDSDPKPGWIVDGQQRALALAKSKRPDLPVPICAFITDEVLVQKEQFLRINNTKPLPQGLVTELLPEVSVPISSRTTPNKLPSLLVDQLNEKEDSPFYNLIKRASSSSSARRNAAITDGPLIKTIKSSLMNTAGCLFRYRNVATGEADITSIWRVVIAYWSAVKATFPEAWGRPPVESRLMHGAGLWAMGRLMDVIMPNIEEDSPSIGADIAAELELIRPHCRWTAGKWPVLEIEWDHLQNVSRHQSAITNYLVRMYLDSRSASRRSSK